MIRLTFRNENLEPIRTDEGIDINAITQVIKRDTQAVGVSFSLVIGVKLIKGVREWLETAYQQCGGIDAIVNVLFEKYNPNTYKWTTYFIGTVDFNNRDLGEDEIIVEFVEGNGFQQNVLNGLDNIVDLETQVDAFGNTLPATEAVNMVYHSKTLRKQLTGNLNVQTNPLTVHADKYVYFPYDIIIDEIAENYYLSFEEAIGDLVEWMVIKEKGKYTFNLGVLQGNPQVDDSSNIMVKWFLKINDESPIPFTRTAVPVTIGMDATHLMFHQLESDELNLNVGDRVYRYALITDDDFFELVISNRATWFPYASGAWPADADTYCKVTALTTVPESNAKTVLIWEAVEKLLQYHTGQIDCLDSSLIGRLEQDYDVDGSLSLIGFTTGGLLRGAAPEGIEISQKISTDLKYILKFLDSIGCIGWGFETDDLGVTRLKIAPKEYFFDASSSSVSLGSVDSPRDRTVASKFYKSIRFGFSTSLENNEINSLDDFTTVRNYNFPLRNCKNPLDITTPMKVSGSQIEQQRRLVGSTETSILDSELFAISLIRDDATFKPKKNEGYDYVSNVFDAGTSYNLDFSPGQTIRTWLRYLAAGLIRSTDKVLKFSSGTTNYLMASKKSGAVEIVENGDINFTGIKPLFDNSKYVIEECEFKTNLVDLVTASPYKRIEFLDKEGNIYYGFIDDEGIEHNNFEDKATVNLLKAII